MTARNMLKILLSLLGIGLLLALWHAGAELQRHAGWYAIGLLMLAGGALPRAACAAAAACVLVLLGNAFLHPGGTILGLGLPHAAWCALLALTEGFLAQESEVKGVRCTSCYWRGPATMVRFGRCPKCWQRSIRDDNRTLLIHA